MDDDERAPLPLDQWDDALRSMEVRAQGLRRVLLVLEEQERRGERGMSEELRASSGARLHPVRRVAESESRGRAYGPTRRLLRPCRALRSRYGPPATIADRAEALVSDPRVADLREYAARAFAIMEALEAQRTNLLPGHVTQLPGHTLALRRMRDRARRRPRPARGLTQAAVAELEEMEEFDLYPAVRR